MLILEGKRSYIAHRNSVALLRRACSHSVFISMVVRSSRSYFAGEWCIGTLLFLQTLLKFPCFGHRIVCCGVWGRGLDSSKLAARGGNSFSFIRRDFDLIVN